MIELGTEGLYYCTSLCLSQFNNIALSTNTKAAVEDFALLSICLMLIMNVSFMLWTAITNIKAKKRQKIVDQRRQVYEEYQHAKEKVMCHPSNLVIDLPSIQECSNENGSSQHKSRSDTPVVKIAPDLDYDDKSDRERY